MVDCNFKTKARGYCRLKRHIALNSDYCDTENCMLYQIWKKLN